MAALLVLLGAAAVLLALGAVARVAPRGVALLQAAFCLVGLLAALFAALFTPGIAVIELGATFATDGLCSMMLAALFLLGACGAAGPVAVGASGLAILAGDAVTLLALATAASLTIPAWRPKAAALGCLAVALLLLAWHGALPDPRFAAMRELPPSAITGGLVVLATLAAAVTLRSAMPPIPGALLALYLLARLLLDLSGPATPGWWGVPVVLLSAVGAAVMARRAAAAADLASSIDTGLQAVLALAACGAGVALLARGADLPPLAALAMTAFFLLVLATSLWGGLALLAVGAIQSTSGTTALHRLGGLLRRTPVTGLALLVALLSAAAMPLSTGFAASWTLLQALLGAARLGNTALLALSAGAVSALGLVLGLLAASALRLLGTTLLGPARSARSAAAVEPAPSVRLAMAMLACTLVATGLFPSLLVLLAQPAIRQLTGGMAEGATVWGMATTADAPGYAVPAVAALLAVCTAAAAWLGRGTTVTAPVWRGGLAEDGPGIANTNPLLLWPSLRHWRPAVTPRLVLVGLGLGLAAALGWAMR